VRRPAPSRAAAFRFWLKLGFISFGGPAGQIAIMHREVVEARGWVGDRDFAHALNFCMLLPGPEALQLAIYLGWRLHGTAGGIVAGLCFILPSLVLMLGLSFLYASFGEVPLVAAALAGLKATVVALVLQALRRLSGKALARPAHWLLATGAFVALAGLRVPFPLVLAAAAAVGAWLGGPQPGDGVQGPAPRLPWRVLVAGLALWAVPLAGLLAWARDGSLFTQVYVFFTQAALVTFGGAYAVLAYVNQQVVDVLGWVTPAQTVAGLGLAESTPGPLIIVLQFIAFMAGWNQPGALPQAQAATLASLLAAWATFLPSFVFILAGAPYVERLGRLGRFAGALSGITAAVVGVIAALAVDFGATVLLPQGLAAPAWGSVLVAAVAFVTLWRTRIDPVWVILAGTLAGLLLAG
jgi:chromate transporter